MRALLLAAMLLCAAPVWATTYHVTTTGNDAGTGSIGDPFRTPAKCAWGTASVAVAGDTCEIHAGTYNVLAGLGCTYGATNCRQGTSFSNAITMEAYSTDVVTFTGSFNAASLIGWGADACPGSPETHRSFYVIFKNIILDGTNIQYPVGGCRGDYIRLDGVTVKNGYGSGILTGDGDYWEILNCNVYNNGQTWQDHGLYASGKGYLIRGGQYHANSGSGIQQFHSMGSDEDDNLIDSVVVYGNGTDVTGTAAGVVLSTGHRNQLRNSLVFSNRGNGVQIDFRCNACAAYNNTIYNSTNGVTISSDSVDVILKNNLINGNATAVADSGSGTVQANNYSGGTPGFRDAAHNNFQLLSSSGAKATGANLSAIFTTDIRGLTRSTWDAGAFSYQAGSYFYADYYGGSNTNSGTTKSDPFKQAPQNHPVVGPVNGCTDNCNIAGVGLAGDDVIVFKGNVTWPYPYLLGIYHSGSSGHQIVYTVDSTWYFGSAWAKPKYDIGYSSQLAVALDQGVNYVTIDNLEIAHISSAVHDSGGLITGVHNQGILMTNLYLHGWRYTGPCCVNDGTGTRTSGAMGGVIFSSFDQGDDFITNTMEDSIIENSENTGTYAGGYSGGMGLAARYIGTMTRVTIHDVTSAVLFTADWNGGTQYNIAYPTGNDSPDHCDSTHCNGVYTNQGVNTATAPRTKAYIRNSVFYDWGSGTNAAFPNPNNSTADGEVDIYNNIFYGHMSSQNPISIEPYLGGGVSGNAGTVRIYNNLAYLDDSGQSPFSMIHVVDRTSNNNRLKDFYSANNYCIGSSGVGTFTMDDAGSGTVSGTISRLTNLPNNNTCQSAATASGQLYTQANLWAPQNGSGSTVGTGTNLSTFFTITYNGITRFAPWDIGPYQWPLPACAGASKLLFVAQPASANLGANLGTVTVGVYDFVGVLCGAATNTVTFSKNGSASWGTLGGTLSVDAVAGLATTTDLSVTGSTGTGSIDAAASGLTGASSNSITISAPAVEGVGGGLRLKLRIR